MKTNGLFVSLHYNLNGTSLSQLSQGLQTNTVRSIVRPKRQQTVFSFLAQTPYQRCFFLWEKPPKGQGCATGWAIFPDSSNVPRIAWCEWVSGSTPDSGVCFPSIYGEMSSGQCCCLPSSCPFKSDTSLMGSVSHITEQNGQDLPLVKSCGAMSPATWKYH